MHSYGLMLLPSNHEEKSVLLEMKGITKNFNGFTANDHVDFDVRYGEIHSLLGENGAGKTTLMKILYGLLRPDFGEIFIRGALTKMKSPRDAIQMGIGMVHQHFMLISQHTVLENIILGISVAPLGSRGNPEVRENKVTSILRNLKEAISMHSHEHANQIIELAKKYNLRINLSAKIWQLSVGERQRVEIIKALYRGAKLLILDEPTSNLTPKENENLFLVLRTMVESGISLVLITHNLHEAMSISDRVTVLRDGKRIATLDRSQLSEETLARLVVAREIVYAKAAHVPVGARQRLRLENIWAKNDLRTTAVKAVSLDVHEAEILGIAGVEGNGQRELIEVVMGLREAEQGHILINGIDVSGHRTSEILGKGVSYIPQDRNAEGLVGDFDISENLILDQYNTTAFSDKFFIRAKKTQEYARSLISEYDIRSRGPQTKAQTLSGGNAQRVIIARELSRNPVVIIANQPTRGLDIASTEFVLNKLTEHRQRGCAVLFSSTELDQLLRVSDRIAVMYEGKIQGLVKPKETEIEQIGLLMLGGKQLPE
jgi:simple sugar transport system ATP-binding protein